jgi:ADP-heptose:LPS heptosyltransferase
VKILGFNQGQIGDLVMNLIACKALKNKDPKTHITFGINKKYESIKPIFYHNNLIDDFKIWENYDNWPSQNDKRYIQTNNFDKVFNPMPKHKYENWYIKYHHTEAVCMMHDIVPPDNLQIELNPWFEKDIKYSNYIAISPFSSGAVPNKDMPKNLIDKIIRLINKLGYDTIQLGLTSHPKINTTLAPIGGSIFEDVKIAYSCKMVITIDTGLSWIMSGYQHKVLSFLSALSYPAYAPLINRTPRNPNAIYLEHYDMNDIKMDIIEASLLKLIK